MLSFLRSSSAAALRLADEELPPPPPPPAEECVEFSDDHHRRPSLPPGEDEEASAVTADGPSVRSDGGRDDRCGGDGGDIGEADERGATAPEVDNRGGGGSGRVASLSLMDQIEECLHNDDDAGLHEIDNAGSGEGFDDDGDGEEEECDFFGAVDCNVEEEDSIGQQVEMIVEEEALFVGDSPRSSATMATTSPLNTCGSPHTGSVESDINDAAATGGGEELALESPTSSSSRDRRVRSGTADSMRSERSDPHGGNGHHSKANLLSSLSVSVRNLSTHLSDTLADAVSDTLDVDGLINTDLEEERRTTDHTARSYSYSGPLVKGLRHGNGCVCAYRDGSKFLGSFRDDAPHFGTLIRNEETYNGGFVGGRYDGRGCNLVKADGTAYSGGFERGKYHGAAGRLEYPGGEGVYEGDFDAGRRHGEGTFTIGRGAGLAAKVNVDYYTANISTRGAGDDAAPDQRAAGDPSGNGDGGAASGPLNYSYSGSWSADLPHGPGTQSRRSPRETFVGRFRSGLRHGAGTLATADGTSLEGVWRDGAPVDGPGWTISYADGRRYVGCAVDGMAHGNGTMRYPPTTAAAVADGSHSTSKGEGGGSVYNGQFKHGQRHGFGLLLQDDGTTTDGLWVRDEPAQESGNDSFAALLERVEDEDEIGMTGVDLEQEEIARANGGVGGNDDDGDDDGDTYISELTLETGPQQHTPRQAAAEAATTTAQARSSPLAAVSSATASAWSERSVSWTRRSRRRRRPLSASKSHGSGDDESCDSRGGDDRPLRSLPSLMRTLSRSGSLGDGGGGGSSSGGSPACFALEPPVAALSSAPSLAPATPSPIKRPSSAAPTSATSTPAPSAAARRATSSSSRFTMSLKSELLAALPDVPRMLSSSARSGGSREGRGEGQINTRARMRARLHVYPNGDAYRGALDEGGMRQGFGLFTRADAATKGKKGTDCVKDDNDEQVGDAIECVDEDCYPLGSTYEGDYLDDHRHGHGVEVIPSLSKYTGGFQFDRRDGEGTLVNLVDSSVYKGQFRDGRFHGRGTLCEGDGTVYAGGFVRGRKEGRGEEERQSAEGRDGRGGSAAAIYRGHFRGGKRNGRGALIRRKTPGGTEEILYDGQWRDGTFHGRGTLYFRNDSSSYGGASLSQSSGGQSEDDTTTIPSDPPPRFEGQFVAGARRGRGTLRRPDGSSMTGPWIDDTAVDGWWTVRRLDGTVEYDGDAVWRGIIEPADTVECLVAGEARGPIPHGRGTRRYTGGDVFAGKFDMGMREGGRLTLSDGSVRIIGENGGRTDDDEH